MTAAPVFHYGEVAAEQSAQLADFLDAHKAQNVVVVINSAGGSAMDGAADAALIEATPHGRRIRVRTSKRKRVAYIPVTEAMGRLLDATPRDRMLILLSERGRPLTPHRASEGLRQWRDKAGLTPEALGYDLRLQDARGTAATRLLSAGLSLAEIAAHMGWSIRHAAAVIEHYARVSPDETDAILVKLATAKGSAS